jgi:branched-chain amino acid transport system substrate-binding protein
MIFTRLKLGVRTGLIVGAAALTVGPLMVGGSIAASATPKSASSVTIGVSEMLTGASEYYGQAALKGVQLATQYLNAHGGILGHHVVLSVADDASLSDQAVDIVRGYAQNSSIPLAIAPTYQPNFEAACSVASSTGLPIIGAQSAPLTKSQNPKGQCFVDTSDLNTQIAAALKTLKTDFKVKSIALLYDSTNAYVSEFDGVIANLVKKAGLKLTNNLAVTTGLTSYGSQITSLLQSKPDVIVPNMVTADAARFMQQARAESVKGMFADLISELTNSDIYSLSSGAAKGLFAATPQSVGVPSFAAFIKLYTARYGAPQDPTYSGFGYDAMMLAASAMEKAGTVTNRKAITAALSKLSGFSGSITYKNMGSGAFLTTTVYYVTLTKSGYKPAKL